MSYPRTEYYCPDITCDWKFVVTEDEARDWALRVPFAGSLDETIHAISKDHQHRIDVACYRHIAEDHRAMDPEAWAREQVAQLPKPEVVADPEPVGIALTSAEAGEEVTVLLDPEFAAVIRDFDA